MEDDRYTRITLRIPKDLHTKLQEASDASSKSVNAEIIGRVEASFMDVNATVEIGEKSLDAIEARMRHALKHK